MALSYGEYLEIDALLSAQKPKAKEHDEMLFIIIHQVYELWFKQIIHEFKLINSCLASGDGSQAYKSLSRVITILKTMVSQLDVLETMTPLSFGSFRDRLENSSGFQSYQFRVFELMLGSANTKAIGFFKNDPEKYEHLIQLKKAPSLFDNFLKYLSKKGNFNIPEDLLNRNFEEPYASNSDVQDILVSIYKSDNVITLLCEKLVDMDEGIQEWRYRHVKMVERTIGNKPGSGGSSGVDYLKKSLFQPIFPDLWAIRSRF